MAKNNQHTLPLTETVFILDRSGSMASLERDTIGGFNSMLQKQKEEDDNALVTTVLFDNQIEILHYRAPIGNIQPLTERDYYARGTTALLDAIGDTINNIIRIHRATPQGFTPTKTLFVIITDGYENASKEFSLRQVKKLIKEQQEKFGWTFLFLGANIDAVETATHIGISKDFAANVMGDKKGTRIMYENLSKTVCCYRKAPKASKLSSNWKESIVRDYNTRSGKGK